MGGGVHSAKKRITMTEHFSSVPSSLAAPALPPPSTTITGIALNKQCFSSVSIIDVAVQLGTKSQTKKFQHHVILYEPNDKQLTQKLRRTIKVGDEITCTGTVELAETNTTNIRPNERLRVRNIPTCVQMRAMNASEVQQLRETFFGVKNQTSKKRNRKKRKRISDTPISSSNAYDPSTATTATTSFTSSSSSSCHSSKTNPREKGNIFVQFILDKMKNRSKSNDGGSKDTQSDVIEQLNSGTGVLDIAGGGGHVSLAFSLCGIQSTIIDPRDTCGILPKRDRKHYRRLLKKKSHATVPFQIHRAWFGGKMNGADSDFSGGNDNDSIPTCGIISSNSMDTEDTNNLPSIMKNPSLIVAMHPDEATESVVDWAILHKKPFFVVPCCVFSRLFPNRTIPILSNDNNGGGDVTQFKLVETTDDFIQYFMNKYTYIKMSTLKMDGANRCIYYTGNYEDEM
jgi:hypothetical protein